MVNLEKYYWHDRQSHWMFANLVLNKYPVNVLNRGLESLVGTVNGLTLDHTGTGFCTGAINTIIDHPLCD